MNCLRKLDLTTEGSCEENKYNYYVKNKKGLNNMKSKKERVDILLVEQRVV